MKKLVKEDLLLREKKCADCYFFEQCHGEYVCDDYFPITQEAIDAEFDTYIESERESFRRDWFEYIEDFCNN